MLFFFERGQINLIKLKIMKKKILCNENGKETFTKIDNISIDGVITSPPYEYRKKRLLLPEWIYGSKN